jgi:hypothetical protein
MRSAARSRNKRKQALHLRKNQHQQHLFWFIPGKAEIPRIAYQVYIPTPKSSGIALRVLKLGVDRGVDVSARPHSQNPDNHAQRQQRLI